ncbi:hypothetical protein ACE6H2_017900 [Prunus campanulata]
MSKASAVSTIRIVKILYKILFCCCLLPKWINSCGLTHPYKKKNNDKFHDNEIMIFNIYVT